MDFQLSLQLQRKLVSVLQSVKAQILEITNAQLVGGFVFVFGYMNLGGLEPVFMVIQQKCVDNVNEYEVQHLKLSDFPVP